MSDWRHAGSEAGAGRRQGKDPGALSSAAAHLRTELGESLSSVQKFDTPLEQATTPSLKALKAFSLGAQNWGERGEAHAIPFFEQAIELDPDFAMAYAYLGIVHDNLGEETKSVENLTKAFNLRDRVTQLEKFLISSLYYQVVTGELEKAIQITEPWAQDYPRDRRPPLNLGSIFGMMGQYEKAISETRKCLDLDPTSVICSGNLIQLYSLAGRPNEARVVYQEAVKRNPDNEALHAFAYGLAFTQSDTPEMERLAKRGANKPGVEDVLLSSQSDTEASFGRLNRAREFSRLAVASARRNDKKETAALWQMNEALREAEFGNAELASNQTKAAMGVASGRGVQVVTALALARAADSSHAERLAAELHNRFPLDTLLNTYWLPTIQATIEINRNHPSKAIELLEPAVPYELGLVSNLEFGALLYPPYVRGQAYLLLGEGGKASVEFQKFLDHRSLLVNNPLYALAHVQLARAYFLQGDSAKAKAAYQELFALWKDADPDIPILIAAKAEHEFSVPEQRYSEDVAVERTEVTALSATRKASPLHDVVLHSPASAPRLRTCTGDANSIATRRKSMSRRIIVPAGNTQPEMWQRGYVYQKGRKQSDPWVPTLRAYGFFRKDVPGQSKQVEVRPALGFCRDRMAAMFKLHQAMQDAGVLDVEKIRERITPATTFESQAAWWLAEIKAARIVNSKTRKPIRPNTTDYYSNAVAYLNEVVGNNALASLDNPGARELVAKMKAELNDNNERRFCDKTIVETFKVFKRVIASAKDEKLRQVYPREWDLVYIGLPKVSKREQHRPTFIPKEIVHIIQSCRRTIYRVAVVLLVATGIRIAELLALEVGKHISPDCTVVYIRQQRGRRDEIVQTPKTDAGYRDVDVHPLVAKMLREYIGNRKSGFLLETETGNMLWPSTLYRDGLKTILMSMGRGKVRFHAFRRFRQAVLEKSEVRQLLIDYWMAHDNSDMSSRYARQLTEDVEFRQEWAKKVGLGFDLSEVLDAKPGLRCATETVEHACAANS